jgi:UDP-N-acetylglucosamine--N-acetylmuramyl-(pentapeptide) pyrophosphoryl-undecaprenol N-acetylglucosamine transferase|tara:strand:+ start:398 stop:931 length:534 start_codon:yes stop_codon:yes gene_type:complete
LQDRQLKVIIAGGGTGGHLFPAFAIADALKKREAGADIHFVGSKYGVELRHFEKRGEDHTLLNIRGFQRGTSLQAVGRNILFPFRFLSSFIRSKKLIKRLDPDVVVGTGGYASGLPLLAAIKKNIPTVIHEQNSYPGFTTRWLADRVDSVCISYSNSEQYLKKKSAFSPETPSGRRY